MVRLGEVVWNPGDPSKSLNGTPGRTVLDFHLSISNRDFLSTHTENCLADTRGDFGCLLSVSQTLSTKWVSRPSNQTSPVSRFTFF